MKLYDKQMTVWRHWSTLEQVSWRSESLLQVTKYLPQDQDLFITSIFSIAYECRGTTFSSVCVSACVWLQVCRLRACGTFSPGAGAEQTWIRATPPCRYEQLPVHSAHTHTPTHTHALKQPAAAAYMMSGPLKSCSWRGQTHRWKACHLNRVNY